MIQVDRFHFETVADIFDGEILAIRKGYRLFHWNTGEAETEAKPGEMLKRYCRSEQDTQRAPVTRPGRADGQ